MNLVPPKTVVDIGRASCCRMDGNQFILLGFRCKYLSSITILYMILVFLLLSFTIRCAEQSPKKVILKLGRKVDVTEQAEKSQDRSKFSSRSEKHEKLCITYIRGVCVYIYIYTLGK